MTASQATSTQRIVQALRQATAQLDALKSRAHEPVAVVGMACRFPGANSPEEFWALLRDGQDMMTAIPSTRWDVEAYYDPIPGTPGKMYVRQGAFVDNVDQFDPQFFGISPREAASLDPQQRFLLEVGWEALERAGLAPDKLRESQTGVYIGITWNDYGRFEGQADRMNTYTANGNGFCFASGRLSYVLGLQGPNMVVDTGCSASLVSVHLACQSLRSGESNLALAGGVNLMLAPETTIGMCLMKALAPDGRCKTFDAAANGYNRGEGCGIIVLKRLSDALEADDNVLAVIRGSAVNHDGPSSGLTVPNRSAQSSLIRSALKNSRVLPHEVVYVEAHGTGTALGDPIEVRALTSVYDTPQRTHPLLVGSAKTNIGHLESAAGVANLMKVILALQHDEIPPHLHFQNPNPYIDWENSSVRVVTERTAWPEGQRLAGVSSFGVGGTNAHIIVEAAPARQPISNEVDRSWRLLPLTAKSEQALRDLARLYSDHLTAHPHTDLGDLCYTAATGRSHFAHRLSVVADSAGQLQMPLSRFADGLADSGVLAGYAPDHQAAPKIAFLFTGQGAQYVDMGRELYETEPAFRNALDRCDEILRPHLEQSLLEVLYPQNSEQPAAHDLPLNQTAYTQPALFALEYALAELWKSWGVEPDVVAGHSVGEIVAACVAGAFSLEDGLKLIAERARLMQALPRDGEMAAVLAAEAQVRAAIAPYSAEVSIAAINGSRSSVISGRRAAIQQIVADLKAKGVKTRMLTVSHAFHSPLMEPLLDDFRQAAQQITYAKPKRTLVSNVTGKPVADEVTDPDYWVRHVRQPVRFADSIAALYKQGVDVFLEIGPKPTLLGMAQDVIDEIMQSQPDAAPRPADGKSDHPASADWPNRASRRHLTLAPSLRQGRNDWRQMLESLGHLYVRGVAVDWTNFDRAFARRKVILPTYPFQRQRYWVDIAPKRRRGDALRPLIHKMTRSPLVKETICETEFSLETLPFLTDHRVLGQAVSPGACQLALVLSGAELAFGADSQIEEVVFPAPLVIPEAGERTVQLVLSPWEADGSAAGSSFQLISFDAQGEGDRPIIHATGRLTAQSPERPAQVALDALRRRFSDEIPLSALYGETSAQQHIAFGPSFQWVTGLWQHDGEALGRLRQPAAAGNMAGYVLHPGLLDACFQVASLAMMQGKESAQEAHVLFAVSALRVYQAQIHAQAGDWWCHARQTGEKRWRIQLLDLAGHALAEVIGFQVRPMPLSALQSGSTGREWLYTVEWQPRPLFGLPTAYLRTPAQLQQKLLVDVDEWLNRPHFSRYLAALTALEAICVDYVTATLIRSGLVFQQGARWNADQVIQQMQVTPRHRRLLLRMLEMLTEQGILSREENAWRIQHAVETPNLAQQIQRLRVEYGDLVDAELTLLERCGEKLAHVMRGALDPLELLFPGGDATVATRLYRESYGAALTGNLVRQAVLTGMEQLPAEQGVRILEVGAGTGGTTAYLLPHLPAQQTRYLFTDIGAAFLNRAQEAFEEYDFVHYQTLDIEQSPSEQGFTPNQAEVIVAADVLHATRDLRQTLAHVRQLLAPGGLLVLLAGTARTPWVDLTFGLTEGWWRFDDDVRSDYPLLNTEEWRQILLASGFRAVSFAPADPSLADRLDRAVIVAQADEGVTATGRSWLLFSDGAGVGEALAAELSKRGEQPFLVFAGNDYQRVDTHIFHIRPDKAEDYQRLLTDAPALNSVVHLWGVDQQRALDWEGLDMASAFQRGCGAALHLVQALLQAQGEPPSLWLVTQGARATSEADSAPGVAQASLWGMGATIAQEHPELNCACIDLDPGAGIVNQAQALAAELLAAPSTANRREDRIALRHGSRLVERLSRLTLEKTATGRGNQAAAGDQALSTGQFFVVERTSTGHENQAAAGDQTLSTEQSGAIRGDGAYLISGGTGGLGIRIAHWLVEQGARRLLLLSRSQPGPDILEQLDRLVETGVEVRVVQADVADRQQVAAVLPAFDDRYPLRGVFHLAGVLDDGMLLQQEWARFARVLAPKVAGAWNLHALTAHLPLDFFVLFSSAVSLLGNRGQANYAAANAFLDSLAHHRRALGLPALTINWGTWSEIGMAANMVRQNRERLASEGVGIIEPEQGIHILAHLLAHDVPQVGVLPIEWTQFTSRFENGFPFLNELVQQARGGDHQLIQQQIALRQELAQAPAAERRNLLVQHLRRVAARVLALNRPEQIDPRQGLMELGLDSLMAVELRNSLVNSLAHPLPSTLLFDYPTVEALALYIDRELFAPDASEVEAPEDEEKDDSMDKIQQLSESDLVAFIADKFKEYSSS